MGRLGTRSTQCPISSPTESRLMRRMSTYLRVLRARKRQSLQRPSLNLHMGIKGHITGLLDWESAGWLGSRVFGIHSEGPVQHDDLWQKTFGGMVWEGVGEFDDRFVRVVKTSTGRCKRDNLLFWYITVMFLRGNWEKVGLINRISKNYSVEELLVITIDVEWWISVLPPYYI